MKDILKTLGSALLGIMIFLLLIFLSILFIKGGLSLAPVVLPWIYLLTGITFLVCLFILLPLSLFRKTRAFAGIGLFTASFIFATSLWLSGFLLSYFYWGMLGIIIGLFFGGIGVVPIAMLASALNAEWSVFIALLLMAFLTFCVRLLGIYLMGMAEDEKYQPAKPIDVEVKETPIPTV